MTETNQPFTQLMVLISMKLNACQTDKGVKHLNYMQLCNAATHFIFSTKFPKSVNNFSFFFSRFQHSALPTSNWHSTVSHNQLPACLPMDYYYECLRVWCFRTWSTYGHGVKYTQQMNPVKVIFIFRTQWQPKRINKHAIEYETSLNHCIAVSGLTSVDTYSNTIFIRKWKWKIIISFSFFLFIVWLIVMSLHKFDILFGSRVWLS